jgi:hypothetical protein
MVLARSAINVHENAFGCQPGANSHDGYSFTGFVHGAVLTKIGLHIKSPVANTCKYLQILERQGLFLTPICTLRQTDI